MGQVLVDEEYLSSLGEEERKEQFLGSNPLDEEDRLKVLEGELNIEGISKRMKKYNNIVVMTGAGISTNAGIPDFRSKGGFYETVDLEKYGLSSPEEMLSLEFFLKNPTPYYERSKLLLKAEISPTKTHKFIVLLHEKRKLLRCYSQNIDGLEFIAGLPDDKLLQCHGRYRTCSCIQCEEPYDIEEFKKLLFDDKLPVICKSCEKEKNYVKPDTVLFGQNLPLRFHQLHPEDMKKCDLLIVMGTSLKVQPFAGLVNKVSKDVPRVLFDKFAVGPFEVVAKGASCEKFNYRDVPILGDCDVKTTEFTDLWKKYDSQSWGDEEDENEEVEEVEDEDQQKNVE